MEEHNMNPKQLIDTATMLVANVKGLLAMDEITPTCNKRFAKLGIPETIFPGIKVDTVAKDLVGHPQEKIIEGPDGLRNSLAEYAQIGDGFAKWRAVIAIGADIPGRAAQQALDHRAKCNQTARRSEYDATIEASR